MVSQDWAEPVRSMYMHRFSLQKLSGTVEQFFIEWLHWNVPLEEWITSCWKQTVQMYFTPTAEEIVQSHFVEGETIEILELPRTSTYVCTGQAIFCGKNALYKNLLISTLDKVICFKGTIFRGLHTYFLFTSQNRVEISWKKCFRFSS
jgi:hypothetical protein